MTGASAPGPRLRAASRRIDWRLGAELLAHGMSVKDTAERLGCSRNQISRRRKIDPDFRGWIDEDRAQRREQATDRMETLQQRVEKAIEEAVADRNVRVILWLADRLKLITPPSERTPEQDLRHLLGGLSQDELKEFEGLADA